MATTPLPGFAIIASVSDDPDVGGASVIESFFAAPNPVVAGAPVTFLWDTVNVPKVQITSTNGYDSGILPSNGSDAVAIPAGFSASASFSLLGLDASGVQIILGAIPLAASLNLTVI